MHYKGEGDNALIVTQRELLRNKPKEQAHRKLQH